MLLIGPESEAFAEDRSRIAVIRKLVEYRETAEPEYPGVPVCNYAQVFNEALGGKPVRKIGLVGWSILPLPVFTGVRAAFPEAELVKADDIVVNQRIIKRPGGDRGAEAGLAHQRRCHRGGAAADSRRYDRAGAGRPV